jgi:hypothetical protein
MSDIALFAIDEAHGVHAPQTPPTLAIFDDGRVSGMM